MSNESTTTTVTIIPIEDIFGYIFIYLTDFANAGGILLEAPVLLFLFKEFTNTNSNFRTAYFIILSYGYFVDLVCFSPFWISKKVNNGDNFLAIPFGIAEWYSDFWYCFWNMVLAFNRATAIWVPFKHSKIWTMRRTFYSIILITIFPLIINCTTYGKLHCLLQSRDPICFPFKIDLAIRCFIVNVVICALVILSVVLSVCASKSVSEKNIQIERRLIVQTTVSSILLCCMFGLYSIGMVGASTEKISWVLAGHLFTYGDLFYILQHFANIAIIIILCPQFRIGLIKFISFGCINLQRSRVSPFNNSSNLVT